MNTIKSLTCNMKTFLIVVIVALMFVMSACNQQAITDPAEVASPDAVTETPILATEIPVPTEPVAPAESPVVPTEPVAPAESPLVPIETAVPTPDVIISVGNITRDPIPISAGESKEIQLQIVEAVDEVEISLLEGQEHVRVDEQDSFIYEYTAPEEGGLDTVKFEVALLIDDSAAAHPQFVFRVIDVELEAPTGKVPCDSRATCGFVAQGTVDGITDDMAVVLFVKPDDSDVWTVHRAGEVTEEGNWEVQAIVRQEPVIVGTNFVVRAMVLPEEDALLLSSEVSEPPAEPLGKSEVSPVQVISGRARLGQSDGQVTITSPVPGAEVPHGESVSILGNATGVPPDGVLWAMVYAPEGKYWPQSPTGCKTKLGTPIEADGQWEIPNVIFGGIGEIQFDVAVLMTESDGEIDMFIRDYLATACETEDFAGLTPAELPAEISEAASVTVIARD